MIHMLRISTINALRAAVLLVLFLGTAHAQSQANRLAPIRLHPANPHYFLFRGKAVALITSGEHYGAVLNPDFDYHRYLAPWARSDTPGYAGGGNKFDLERWDAAFFTRYRDFLGEAAKHGIVVEVTLFSSHYDENQWRLSALNLANNINDTKAIDWMKLHT